MSMSADLSNKVTIDSVLERPEWGGDGEVYVDIEVGADKLRVEAFLAGEILEDKGFGEPKVGFSFHYLDVWLNGVELWEPFAGVTNTVKYIRSFVDGTREYNDLYDDLKEEKYLLHNLEDKLQGITSISDLENSLSTELYRNDPHYEHAYAWCMLACKHVRCSIPLFGVHVGIVILQLHVVQN